MLYFYSILDKKSYLFLNLDFISFLDDDQLTIFYEEIEDQFLEFDKILADSKVIQEMKEDDTDEEFKKDPIVKKLKSELRPLEDIYNDNFDYLTEDCHEIKN